MMTDKKDKYILFASPSMAKRMASESIPSVYPRSIDKRIGIASRKIYDRYIYRIFGFECKLVNNPF
jgi:hypothetical protein